jgi:hypothetical protein
MIAEVRLILALTVFVASLGVVTSGRLVVPRDLRISANGDDEHCFPADVNKPISWSPPSDKKRLAPVSLGGQLIVPSPSSALAPLVSRGGVVRVAPVVRPAGDATRLASPRAPPCFPS